MNKELYKRLTESAKKELSNSTQEIHELLIYKAHLIAKKKNTADKEISLSDILSAKNQLLSNECTETRKNKAKRQMLLFTMIGIIYTFVGIFFYLFQNYSFDKKNIGLIIAALGALVSIFPVLYFNMSRITENAKKCNNNSERLYNEFAIINRWQTIEMLGMDLMVRNGFLDEKNFSVDHIVKYLYNNIPNISTEELISLLKTRNELVHKGIKLSKDEFESILAISDKIICELKHKLEEKQ